MSGKITNKLERAKVEKFAPSSGNVFADLDLPDAQERMLRAQLAARIAELIVRKGWTEAHAARVVGLDQPKVSPVAWKAVRLFGRLAHQYP